MKHTIKSTPIIKPKKGKPETEAQWAALRCRMSCKIGRDAIEGRKHEVPDVLEYAVHCLLHAIEDLSKQIEESK